MPVILRKRAGSSPAPASFVPERSLPALRGRKAIEVPDPDFHDFDSTRTAKDIQPGQIWAIYDDKDAMPRYYGRISSVSLSPFKVEFVWLVFDERSSEESKLWCSSSGYYIGTGKFDNGDPSTTKVINIFSHRMYVKEQFRRGKPTRIIIYPRKGDVWAMYRNWNQARAILSPDPRSNLTCEFDLVEILVDYSKENGVKTVTLAKMPDFRTVFQRQDGPQAVHTWTTSDLLRFSHTVPVLKIKQSKVLGIPKQAMELDPAAIPVGYSTNLEHGPGDLEMIPGPQPDEDNEESGRDMEVELIDRKRTSARPSNKRLQQRSTGAVSTLALSQDKVSPSQDTDNSFIEQEKAEQARQLDGILTVSASGSSTMLRPSEADFYDFSSLRTETDIEAGQIWAVYDAMDQMPRIYVRVARVFESPFKVDVWRLKPDPPPKKMKDCSGEAVSCGTFKNDKRDVMGLKCFSHLVLDRARDHVKIYPRREEVWAIYRNWDLENSGRKVQVSGTLHASGYDFVEILSDFLAGKGLRIARLDKVNGFKSLFQRQGHSSVTENVRPDALRGFSHSIPARRMYKDDTLHIPFGALEVDPACIPLQSAVLTRSMRAPQTRSMA